MDFINFVEKLTNDEDGLRLAFANKIRSVRINEIELKKFFEQNGYTDISEEECQKMIAVVNAIGKGKAGDIVLQY